MGCPACELPEPTEVVEIIAGLEGERDAWQDMANTERLLRFADAWVAIGYAATREPEIEDPGICCPQCSAGQARQDQPMGPSYCTCECHP